MSQQGQGTNTYLGVYDSERLNRFLEWNTQKYSSRMEKSNINRQQQDLDETLERGSYIFILSIIAFLSCFIGALLIMLGEP